MASSRWSQSEGKEMSRVRVRVRVRSKRCHRATPCSPSCISHQDMRFWPRCHPSGRWTGGFGTIQWVGLGHHRGFAGSIPARQAFLASGGASCSYKFRAGVLEQQQHLLGSSHCELLLFLTTTFGTQQLLPRQLHCHGGTKVNSTGLGEGQLW